MQLVLNFVVLNTVAGKPNRQALQVFRKPLRKFSAKLPMHLFYYIVLDVPMQACMPPIWLPILTLRQSALNGVG